MTKSESPGTEATQPTKLDVAEQPNWALIVVHGVGQTEPGATIDALLPALSAVNPKIQLSGVPEVRLLDAPLERTGDLYKSFPVHIRQMKDPKGVPGVVAEVYWADLSQVRDGVLHLLWGVFVTIFGLHHIVDEASAQPGIVDRFLRSWLYAAGWLLRGPIAAFNCFALILLLIHGLPCTISPHPDWVGVGLGLIGIGGGAVMWLKLKGQSPSWETFWGALAFVGAGMAGVTLMRIAAPDFCLSVALKDWIEAGRLYKPLMDTKTVTEAEAWSIVLVREPIDIAWKLQTLVVVIGAGVWMVACLTAWLTSRVRDVHALTLAYVTAIMQNVLWVLIIPMLFLMVMRSMSMPQSEINVFDKGGWQILGVQYILASILLSVVGLTWVARWLQTHSRWAGRPLPRLLVGRWIQAFLIGIVLGGSGYYLIDNEFARLAFFPGQDIAMAMAPVFIFLATVIPASGPRSGLHIVADVINHFYRVPGRLPVPGGATPEADREFVIRKQIEARFQIVLAEVLKLYPVTHLFVLAHSQGTVAVAGALRQKETADNLNVKGLKISLVTMGSPLTHLYQHYFPHQYPSFDEEYWCRFRGCVQRWLNLYRIDDFVGTLIAGPKGMVFQNEHVSTGGHVNYWRQRVVLDKLSEFFFSDLVGDASADNGPPADGETI